MDPFIGEIRIFAGNYAPPGWALCNGDILQIQQHTALFALFGNTYGGDGRTTFALPDLRGKAAMHWGNGPGLTPRTLGRGGGNITVKLNTDQMPNHSHVPNCQSTATINDPAGTVWANTSGFAGANVYNDSPNVNMSPSAIAPAGGDQPHNNMQPYLGLSFIIAVGGIFPPHS